MSRIAQKASGEYTLSVNDALEDRMHIRPLQPVDLSAVVALNNAHTVEISLADDAKMSHLFAIAALATAIGEDGDPDAFLIAFDDRTPSQGPNHAWFLERHPRFLYVDRICVQPRARRRGLARTLYQSAFETARQQRIPLVCCEVNREPPNPASDAFHHALGFVEVGSAFLPDRGKLVKYLERRLP